jgi:hypothetical protein
MEGRGFSPFSGGLGEGETPLPIPNRAVKPLSADGTWPARAWESRTPPVYFDKRAAFGRLVVVNARPRRSFSAAAYESRATPAPGTRQAATARAPEPRPKGPRGRCSTEVHDEVAQGDGVRTLCAAALDAGVGRGEPHPGRPPSRRRCRPRATGRSGPREQHRARAAQALICSSGGTCVRKVRSQSDGYATNMRAHSAPAP